MSDSPDLSATPIWAMAVSVVVAGAAGVSMAVRTAELGCRHHTIDACIPVLDGLLGVIVAVVVFVWLAASRRRGRSIVSGLASSASSVVAFHVLFTVAGAVACPDPHADDHVCSLALPLGVALFAALAAFTRRRTRRLPSR